MFKAFLALAAGLWLAAGAALAAPTLDDYARLPGIEQAVMSPSGARYALVALVADKRRLLVFDAADKPLQNLVLPDEFRVRSLAWAGDDIILVERVQTRDLPTTFVDPRGELTQTVAIHVDGSKAVQMFNGGPAKDRGVWGYFGTAKVDGAWVGYFRGMTAVSNRITFATSKYTFDLYRIDLGSGRTTLIDPMSDEFDGDWLFDADGRLVARATRKRLNGDWSLLLGGDKVMEGPDRLGDLQLTGLGRTPGAAVFQKAKGDAYAFMEWTRGAAEPVELFPGAEILRLIHDPNTRLLLGYQHLAAVPTYSFADAAFDARAKSALRAFAGQRPRLVSWNTAFDKFIVYVEGDTESGAYFIVDLAARSARQLGLNYPTVTPQDVGPVRAVTYKAADGTEVEAILTLPPGRAATNLPVIVLPHDGPRDRDEVGFNWWAQAFASRGYAVLQPNYRGSSGYGRAFEAAGWGQWGVRMQTDLSDGVGFLAAEGIVDPRRACIVGAGYGGYAAVAGVTVQQGVYRCAVAFSGMLDPQTWLNETTRTDDPIARRYWRQSMGADTVKLDEISPLALARRADAPVLLIHGKDDTVNPISQSERMAAALRAAGRPVEIVRLEREDHWLSRSSARIATLRAAVAFVERNNPAR